jgi:hypothetical protein
MDLLETKIALGSFKKVVQDFIGDEKSMDDVTAYYETRFLNGVKIKARDTNLFTKI